MTLLLNEILAVYAEVFGADLLRYLIGAGGVYLVINVALARHLSRQKIRTSGPPKGQIKRELIASFRTVMIFAATGTCIAFGARSGCMEIYQDVATYGVAYFLLSAAALILLHDAWFYWSHRALHYPPIFRRFHRLHHRSHSPTPFTSYSFDIGEAVVNAVYLPLALLVIPAHPIVLFIFVTHMMLRNALGHCGVEVFPARRDGRPLLGWMTTVTHHDLHHAHAGYNHGLYFAWWDKWMGTEHPQYFENYARVAPRLGVKTVRGTALVALIAIVCLVGRAQAFDLNGHYATPGLGAIVKFEPCADRHNTVCARLVWAWDPSQMAHAKIGQLIAPALAYQDGAWRGRMLNPESGWTFKGTIHATASDRLNLRGCAGPICVNQTWRSTKALRRILSQTP
ncbi:MAG: sterol desaturase family protein [Pseudomonadota bacterium]